MALKLRYNSKDGTIRSVSSAPNGILVIGGNDDVGAVLAVHPKAKPPANMGPGATIQHMPGDPVREGNAAAISADEAMEAAADLETAAMIWKLVYMALCVQVEALLHSMLVEDIEAFTALAKDTRDAMVAHGYIEKGE